MTVEDADAVRPMEGSGGDAGAGVGTEMRKRPGDQDAEVRDAEAGGEAEEPSIWETELKGGDGPPPETFGARMAEIVRVIVPLGMIAFGGPQAHVAILHEQFVVRRKWLSDTLLPELLGLGQFLPGPTSTQMVIAIATIRAGIPGGILAFFCWCLPGLTVMTLAGVGVDSLPEDRPGWLTGIEDGLASAGVALVAIAAWRLGKKLCYDKLTRGLMVVSAGITILRREPWLFPLILVVGGLISYFYLDREERKGVRPDAQGGPKGPGAPSMEAIRSAQRELANLRISVTSGALLAVLFFALLTLLIVLRRAVGDDAEQIKWAEAFYRTGAFIYGGGQVVLPMLLSEVVETGWITETEFFNGFAIVQGLPGPLFNFSAYLGAVIDGVPGALITAVSLFSPGIISLFAVLPFYKRIRQTNVMRLALVGINASAIGFVIAAVYLLFTTAVTSKGYAVICLCAFSLVLYYNVQAPYVILLGGFFGYIVHLAS